MYWTLLIIAGLFEVGFTTCLSKIKTASAASLPFWWAGFVASLLISMYLLYISSKHIHMGTAYAVWTGIGAFGTVLVGILFFKEPADSLRLVFIGLLIFSVAGLKMVSIK